MEELEAPEEEMLPSAAPPAAAASPWGKIAAVLLAVLIVLAAVNLYYVANPPPAGDGEEIDVTCPAGYTYNSDTTTCESTDTTVPTAVGTADKETVEIGEVVTFDGSASTDNVAVTAWVWNFGDRTHAMGSTVTKTYGFPGSHIVTVTVSDALGNSDVNNENLIRIRVLDPPVEPSNNSAPVAILAVDNDVIRPGESVFFDATSSWIYRWNDTVGLRAVCTDCGEFTQESDAMTYAWDFADGGTMTTVNGSHTFDTAGTYGVRLTLTGYNGRTSVKYHTIHVLPPAIPFGVVKNPNTIVRATFGEVANLDPARAYDSSSGEILDQVYEKLVFYDRDSITTFRPMLATNVPTPDANGEYRFTIRQGVTFHNGQSFGPDDVEYSIERNLISDFTGGPMWILMEIAIGPGVGSFDPTDALHRQRVQDFVRVEGNDVVFNLTFPFPFLPLISTWGSWIMDKQTTIADGGWPQLYDQTTLETYNDDLSLGTDDWAIGTGPYMLQSWDFGVQVVLKKNPSYWNAAANPDAVDTVIIKKVVEAGTRLLMLQNGDADFGEMQIVSKPQVLPLQQQGLVNVIEGLPQLSIVASHINQDIAPTSPYGGVIQPAGNLDAAGIPVDFFSDINVRRGLAYCMDYDTLIADTQQGNAQQARGPIPEPLQGYSATSPVYTLNTVLAEAEFTAAWGGTLWTTGFTFEFLYNEGNLIRQTAATMMSDCVNNLNPLFTTTTRGVPWSTYLGALFGNEWTVATIGWGADYADAHNFAAPFLDSRGAGFFALFLGYQNTSAEALLDQGLTTVDPAQRELIYTELQMVAYNDVPAVYLYQPNAFEVHRTWINGWYHNDMLGEDTYFFDYTKG